MWRGEIERVIRAIERMAAALEEIARQLGVPR